MTKLDDILKQYSTDVQQGRAEAGLTEARERIEFFYKLKDMKIRKLAGDNMMLRRKLGLATEAAKIFRDLAEE